MSRARVLLVPLPLVLVTFTGCATVAFGGAIGFDAGTIAADGVETGIGFQLEAIGYPWEESGFGLGPSVQLGGYSSTGDADPIAFISLEVRHHSIAESPTRPFLELGTGVGLAWTPNVHHVAIPLQVELGLERDLGPLTGRLGVRERLLGLIGSGSPPLDAFNSVQLVLGVKTGNGR